MCECQCQIQKVFVISGEASTWVEMVGLREITPERQPGAWARREHELLQRTLSSFGEAGLAPVN